MIRPIGLYACEIWKTTKADGQSLAVFERKILRWILGSKRYKNTREFEKRANQKVREIFGETDILVVTQQRKVKG